MSARKRERSGCTNLARTLCLCAALTLLVGCAAVKIQDTDPRDYVARNRGDVLSTGEIGPATREALQVLGLDPRTCSDQPAPCLQSLARSNGLGDEARLSALAELWLHQALAGDRGHAQTPLPDSAFSAYLEAARHAYAYLFHTARRPGQRAFEDRQTQVRDYYNYASQQVVSAQFQRIDHDDPVTVFETAGWRITGRSVDVRLPQLQRLPRELVPAAPLSFRGLRSAYRRDGFGAEFVAVAAPYRFRKDLPRPAFRELRYLSATVVLRFAGADLDAVLRTHTVNVDVLDPYRHTDVQIGDLKVPLAANFTAPYGLWLSRSSFGREALRSLLGRGQDPAQPRVYLLQPYDPQRRTIIMLHGLASSPQAWINVANELIGDETLRRRAQIWQVYYPTNAPIAENHIAIRRAIEQTLREFDPSGQAPASRDIVLVGHSMGGVIARLMVSDSGERMWQALLGHYKVVDEAQRRKLEVLDPYLRFAPEPYVGRAVFIAAPHRGTPIAGRWFARLISRVIRLPVTLLQQFDDVFRVLGESAQQAGGQPLRAPNSIDNLSDRDPFVQASGDLPIAAGLRYHSIIGRIDESLPLAQSSDGMVPYASAHLDGAQSERVLHSNHSVQEQPLAILELRRILREHLAALPR